MQDHKWAKSNEVKGLLICPAHVNNYKYSLGPNFGSNKSIELFG